MWWNNIHYSMHATTRSHCAFTSQHELPIQIRFSSQSNKMREISEVRDARVTNTCAPTQCVSVCVRSSCTNYRNTTFVSNELIVVTSVIAQELHTIHKSNNFVHIFFSKKCFLLLFWCSMFILIYVCFSACQLILFLRNCLGV